LLGDESRVRVFPVELLDREAVRRLARLDRETGEHRVAGQGNLAAGAVDPVDGKPETPVRPPPVTPRDGDHVVIGKGDRVLHDDLDSCRAALARSVPRAGSDVDTGAGAGAGPTRQAVQV
jgi:hypothetical protein